MPNYYVSAIVHYDMCIFSHRPVRAKNPYHAEEKFFGKMGYNRGAGNFAERIVLWRNRNKSVKNLLRSRPV